MPSGDRVQATLFLRDLAVVEELRRSLDPEMAARIPAHVTVIYDDEAADADLLIERLREACGGIPPVVLELGSIAAFDSPHEGLYVATTASEGLAELRASVLRSPFAPRGPDVWPHVTVLHPRSAAACEADWRSYIGQEIGRSVTVENVDVVQFRDGRWHERETIRLERP